MDLCIEPGQSLGLMIRGGLEYNLGIYITGVDKDSVADRAGLMVRTSYTFTALHHALFYLMYLYSYSILVHDWLFEFLNDVKIQ